jgi:outer membrane biosynthesis protein TonB
MRGSLTISVIAHVVLLAACLIAFTIEPTEAPAVPSVTVDTISINDFNQLTQGIKDAPKLKVDDIKPLADKIDLPKPADQTADKVADKPEIKTETEAKQQPPKPDPKPADKPAKPKTPDYKPDQIADLLKKDAAKQPPKIDTKPTPDNPAQNQPKFDANQVAQLLDHRDPRRQVAAADALNNQPSLGDAHGGDAALSEDEKSYIRNHISSCWSPPPGIDAASKVKVTLRVLLKQDGTLATQPVVVEGTPSALGPALAASAIRAVISCQPFNKLRPEHYDEWRDLTLDFDPPTLFGGG